MKYTFIMLILLVCGTAIAESNNNLDTYKKVNRPNVEYFYSGVFFHKKNGDFRSDFSKCHDYQLQHMDSEGVGVLKSLGRSDEQIVSNGTKDCLFANDWKLYTEENGKLQQLMFSYLYFRTRNSMTADEIKQSELDLIDRKKWYKKYAPNLLSH